MYDVTDLISSHITIAAYSNTVWGIGSSPEEAYQDAIENLSETPPAHVGKCIYLETYPSSIGVCSYVSTYGGAEVPFVLVEYEGGIFVAFLEDEIDEIKTTVGNEAGCLINNAVLLSSSERLFKEVIAEVYNELVPIEKKWLLQWEIYKAYTGECNVSPEERMAHYMGYTTAALTKQMQDESKSV